MKETFFKLQPQMTLTRHRSMFRVWTFLLLLLTGVFGWATSVYYGDEFTGTVLMPVSVHRPRMIREPVDDFSIIQGGLDAAIIGGLEEESHTIEELPRSE
ncbi:MAG: hypothetical protein HY006_00030 [Candidatus Sungbacteria bacterium]|nr:hypothetical protein [Candidatus Sungbacteria bacterium]